jgi:hypothetical protein
VSARTSTVEPTDDETKLFKLARFKLAALLND